MRVTKIYSFVEPATVNKGWRAICMSECGNLYVDTFLSTEVEARNEVFQKVKNILNNIDHGDMKNWYEIVETTRDSEEFKEAFAYHCEFTVNPPDKTISYKLEVFWLTACWYGRYAMEWVRYLKGLFTRSE